MDVQSADSRTVLLERFKEVWNGSFDENGNAVMVDVSEKEITERIAVASGKIRVNDAVMSAIVNHTAKKRRCADRSACGRHLWEQNRRQI